MVRSNMRLCLSAAALAALVAGAGGPAFGQAAYTWTARTGLFSDPTSWNPPGVPLPPDFALFGDPAFGAQFIVDFDGDFQNNRAKVEQGAVLWMLNGHIYDLWLMGDPTDVSLAIGCETGVTANAQLTLVGGNVTPRDGRTGLLPENSGELIVGAGARYTAFMCPLTTGELGQGRLTVRDGGVVEHGHGFAAVGGTSTGIITVTGPGSLYWVTGYYALGARGAATMTVEAGGTARMGRCEVGVLRDSLPGSRGTVVIDGPGSLWHLTSEPEVSLTLGLDGTGTATVRGGGRIRNDGELTLARNPGSGGSLTITGPGSLVDCRRGLFVGNASFGTVAIDNGGALVVGGDLVLGENDVGRGSLTVSGPGSSAYSNMDGYLFVGQWGAGTLTVANGGLASFSSVFLANRWSSRATALVDGPGSTLHVWHNLLVGGDAVEPGGTASLTVSNGGTVLVENEGMVYVRPASSVTVRSRGSVFAAMGQVDPGGLLRIEDGLFFAPEGMGNDGEIQMASDLARLDTDTVLNNGNLFGTGAVTGSVHNAGVGVIYAGSGDGLVIGGYSTNAGRIILQNGVLAYNSTLVNMAGGKISGRGTLVTGAGLENHGQMLFSAGMTDVFGPVSLLDGAGGGEVITTGTGATTTFYDDFDHHGDEVRTATGCMTVFFGTVTGPGPFTGGGTVRFEGAYLPGASPSAVAFGGDLEFGSGARLLIELAGRVAGDLYDQVNVAGGLSLDGDLAVVLLGGFAPSAGDAFDILNFGSLGGAFDRVSLPALGSGLAWDASALYTTGTLNIVPEPATLALAALGAAALLIRRRREAR